MTTLSNSCLLHNFPLPQPGQKIYPDFSRYGYQIEYLLGQNQLGGRLTYKALHLQSGKAVVIKQFQFIEANNWSEYEAYEREMQILKRLNHPGIPRYLDEFETPTGFCLVTEYKNAPSLAIRQNFSTQQIKEIAIALLEILVYLQSACPPIIHRDIKPENILVDSSEGIKVYLVNFDYAYINDGQMSTNCLAKGTFGFMPPEQILNVPLTEASDLYSIGVTLICLLTGTQSTEISNLIDENNRININQLKLKLDRQFLRWLEQMVNIHPQNRYPNAVEALQVLERIDVIEADSIFTTGLSRLKHSLDQLFSTRETITDLEKNNLEDTKQADDKDLTHGFLQILLLLVVF